MTNDTPAGIVIRAAIDADVPALGRLGALLVHEHHAFDPKRFLAPQERTADYYGAFLGSQLDSEDAVLFVAEDDGRVIAYAYGTMEGYDYMALRGPAAALQDVIVDADYRGRGVGRLLLTELFAQFEARNAPRVVLSTAEHNHGAQRLFARMGFRRTMVEMTRELKDSSETT